MALDRLGKDEVYLRWQRIDEVSRLMASYGYLLGKSKMTNFEKGFLEKIPYYQPDIYGWIVNKEYLKC